MKHLKLFEEVFKYKPTPTPEIGDWVFAYDVDLSNDFENSEKMNDYIQTHIGQVVNAKTNQVVQGYLVIEYTNITDDTFVDFKENSSKDHPVNVDSKSATMNLQYEEITYWSSNREELQQKMDVIITSSKYNI